MTMIEVISQVAISTILLLISARAVKLPPKPYHQDAKFSVSTSKDKLDKKEKISKFIKLVQPRYSQSYIKKITDAIMKYAAVFKVDPYVIASTAYVESEFKMTSRPCIGMMQLVRPSIRYYDPKRVYNPFTIDGNIAIGTKELSRHLKRYSRGKLPNRTAYRNMYRSYNGSYMKNRYSVKTLLVQTRLEHLSLDVIKSKLKKGPIWK
jgi:soluble lytic murein transglycosylase-like protein